MWKDSRNAYTMAKNGKAYEIDGQGVQKIGDIAFVDWKWMDANRIKVQFKDAPNFIQREIESLL
jgi:hypothetical protein